MGKTRRVAVYVDGLNLHNGLLSSGSPRWVDLIALGRNVLRPGQALEGVRYFTSRLVKNTKDQYEQDIYLQALEARDVEIVLGQFDVQRARCPRCGRAWLKAEEKQTDVNIAVRLLTDAHQDLYDRAVLLSADSDLLRPVLESTAAVPRQEGGCGISAGTRLVSIAPESPLFSDNQAHGALLAFALSGRYRRWAGGYRSAGMVVKAG